MTSWASRAVSRYVAGISEKQHSQLVFLTSKFVKQLNVGRTRFASLLLTSPVQEHCPFASNWFDANTNATKMKHPHPPGCTGVWRAAEVRGRDQKTQILIICCQKISGRLWMQAGKKKIELSPRSTLSTWIKSRIYSSQGGALTHWYQLLCSTHGKLYTVTVWKYPTSHKNNLQLSLCVNPVWNCWQDLPFFCVCDVAKERKVHAVPFCCRQLCAAALRTQLQPRHWFPFDITASKERRAASVKFSVTASASRFSQQNQTSRPTCASPSLNHGQASGSNSETTWTSRFAEGAKWEDTPCASSWCRPISCHVKAGESDDTIAHLVKPTTTTKQPTGLRMDALAICR